MIDPPEAPVANTNPQHTTRSLILPRRRTWILAKHSMLPHWKDSPETRNNYASSAWRELGMKNLHPNDPLPDAEFDASVTFLEGRKGGRTMNVEERSRMICAWRGAPL